MVGTREWLRDRLEATVADLDEDGRIGQQVRRPSGSVTGGDEHGSIRLVDVADGHWSPRHGTSAARGDPGDLPLEEQVLADVVRGRQRPLCQDLPSVWVDGA